MESKIKHIVADILDVDEVDIHDGFGPDAAPLWDSMNNLRLITAFEDEFQIKLSMEDIKSMTDFGQIKSVLSSYLGIPCV